MSSGREKILVDEFVNVMERLAPAALAAEWDNVGLQVGSRADKFASVLIALDFNDSVLAQAQSAGCGLVLVHHPLIFEPLASLSSDTETGRLICAAHAAGIAIFAAHTNLDSAPGGFADALAGLLGIVNAVPIEVAGAGNLKLVTFVPPADLDRVSAALFQAGAGIIGNYDHCSYVLEGKGTFRPLERAQPALGRVGRDEKATEQRLEMVFPAGKAADIVPALKAAHPYEEPAYDIYPLGTIRHDAGQGRLGDLSPATLAGFAARAAGVFDQKETAFLGDPEKTVLKAAVVPGSGAGYIGLCAARGVDVLVTGDIRYHQAQQALASDVALVDIPHDVSEQVAMENWMERLRKELPPDIDVICANRLKIWRRTGKQQRSLTDESRQSLFQLHVDGGSRGNPGPAAIGAVLVSPEGKQVEALASYIGETTNNAAEYQALIAGVEMAIDRGIMRIAIYSDSELIVRQLKGEYKVKNEGLQAFYRQARSALARLEGFELISIPRQSNQEADRLVNRALDESE